MQDRKRFAVLFLAALMMVSLVSARPAEAAETYTYAVTVEGGHGTVKISGIETPSRTFEAGAVVLLDVIPDEGYMVDYVSDLGAVPDWFMGNSIKGYMYSLKMPAHDQEVTVRFREESKNLGKRMMDLRKGQVTVSDPEDGNGILAFLDGAIDDRLITVPFNYEWIDFD